MGLGNRDARRHQTRLTAGVDPSTYWDFQPGQAVLTVDGFLGKVVSVFDGPFAGSEEYEVELDNGLGGGAYTASQLRPTNDRRASHEHEANTAAADYPELHEVLRDRLDPGRYPSQGAAPPGMFSLSSHQAATNEGQAPGVCENGHLTWGDHCPACRNADSNANAMVVNEGDHRPQDTEQQRNARRHVAYDDDDDEKECEVCGGEHDTDDHEDEPEEHDDYIGTRNWRHGGWNVYHGDRSSLGGQCSGRHDNLPDLETAAHVLMHCQHSRGYFPNVWDNSYGSGPELSGTYHAHVDEWGPNIGGSGPVHQGAAHPPLYEVPHSVERLQAHLMQHHEVSNDDLTNPWSGRDYDMQELRDMHAESHQEAECPVERDCPWNRHAHHHDGIEQNYHSDNMDDDDEPSFENSAQEPGTHHQIRRRLEQEEQYEPGRHTGYEPYVHNPEREVSDMPLEGESVHDWVKRTTPSERFSKCNNCRGRGTVRKPGVPPEGVNPWEHKETCTNCMGSGHLRADGSPATEQGGHLANLIRLAGMHGMPLFQPGDRVITSRGESATVTHVRDSGHPGKSNKVTVKHDEGYTGEYYEQVFKPHPDAPQEQHDWYHQRKADNKAATDLLKEIEDQDPNTGWSFTQHDAAKVTRHDDGSSSWDCESCGEKVHRHRGEVNAYCPKCDQPYNAGGQRLRRDFDRNPSNWDENIGDAEGQFYADMGIDPWEHRGSRQFDAYSLIREASLDPSLGFHVLATWRDVQSKAKRIRSTGGVRITANQNGYLVGEIKGDHNVYQTRLQRVPGRQAVASWECGCKWASYSWGRSGPWAKYEGRMCSHALALHYEAQKRGMFGADIEMDRKRPSWLKKTTPVVVEWDKDGQRNIHAVRKHAYGPGPIAFRIHPYGTFCPECTRQEVEHAPEFYPQHGDETPIEPVYPWETDDHEGADCQCGAHLWDGEGHTRQDCGGGHVHEVDHDYPWKRVGGRPNPDDQFGSPDYSEGDPFAPRTVKHSTQDSPVITFIREALLSGEDPEEVAVFLNTLAAVNSPFGDPSPDEVARSGPGPTQPRNYSENPAQAGFLTANDPDSWNEQNPQDLGDRMAAKDEETEYEPGLGCPHCDHPGFYTMPERAKHIKQVHPDEEMGMTPEMEMLLQFRPELAQHMRHLRSTESSLEDSFEPEISVEGGLDKYSWAQLIVPLVRALAPTVMRSVAPKLMGEVAEQGAKQVTKNVVKDVGKEVGKSLVQQAPKQMQKGIQDFEEERTEEADQQGQQSRNTQDAGMQQAYSNPYQGSKFDEATLHDEPEPALPTTDGAEDNDEVFTMADTHTARQWSDEDDDSLEYGYPTDPGNSNPAGMVTAPGTMDIKGDPTSLEPSDPSFVSTGSVADIVEQFQTTAGAKALDSQGQQAQDSGDIAAAAREHLAKTSMAEFTPAQQAELINEGEGVKAGNLDRLEITGTHYEALDAALGDDEDEETWTA